MLQPSENLKEHFYNLRNLMGKNEAEETISYIDKLSENEKQLVVTQQRMTTGQTLLHLGIHSNYGNVVEKLLEIGANSLYPYDNFGKLPLHYAVERATENGTIFSILVKHLNGAKENFEAEISSYKTQEKILDGKKALAKNLVELAAQYRKTAVIAILREKFPVFVASVINNPGAQLFDNLITAFTEDKVDAYMRWFVAHLFPADKDLLFLKQKIREHADFFKSKATDPAIVERNLQYIENFKLEQEAAEKKEPNVNQFSRSLFKPSGDDVFKKNKSDISENVKKRKRKEKGSNKNESKNIFRLNREEKASVIRYMEEQLMNEKQKDKAEFEIIFPKDFVEKIYVRKNKYFTEDQVVRGVCVYMMCTVLGFDSTQKKKQLHSIKKQEAGYVVKVSQVEEERQSIFLKFSHSSSLLKRASQLEVKSQQTSVQPMSSPSSDLSPSLARSSLESKMMKMEEETVGLNKLQPLEKLAAAAEANRLSEQQLPQQEKMQEQQLLLVAQVSNVPAGPVSPSEFIQDVMMSEIEMDAYGLNELAELKELEELKRKTAAKENENKQLEQQLKEAEQKKILQQKRQEVQKKLSDYTKREQELQRQIKETQEKTGQITSLLSNSAFIAKIGQKTVDSSVANIEKSGIDLNTPLPETGL